MSAGLRTWSTHGPCPEAFAGAWRARLARATHAHFALSLEFLAWRATHGEHALAVLADRDGQGGAFVLREQRGGWVSGWPWRWQAVIEDPSRDRAEGLSAGECEWIVACATDAAEARRLRLHLPGGPGPAAYLAGATYLNPLDRADEELLRTMDGDKRRTIKKAGKAGWCVREGTSADDFRAFAELQRAAERRRGREPAALPDAPGPGESWREWELPWMGLLVAEKDGTIDAGSGFGWVAGGMLDYRANASSERGRREGANVLLAYEAMRLGRERGMRWINWGGATLFKRDFGGVLVPVSCRLAGGPAWTIPNRLQASLRRARPRVAAALKRLGVRRPA